MEFIWLMLISKLTYNQDMIQLNFYGIKGLVPEPNSGSLVMVIAFKKIISCHWLRRFHATACNHCEGEGAS